MISPIENSATFKLLLTVSETCTALGCCRRTLYDLTAPRGPIPVVPIGKFQIRYSVDAIRAWIASAETSTPEVRPKSKAKETAEAKA